MIIFTSEKYVGGSSLVAKIAKLTARKYPVTLQFTPSQKFEPFITIIMQSDVNNRLNKLLLII
jgi:hypothetical protein